MFTNWLNNTYIILIIYPSNFCWEYSSPPYNHFTNNYTVFFDIIISLLSQKPFHFKTSPRILLSIFLTPIFFVLVVFFSFDQMVLAYQLMLLPSLLGVSGLLLFSPSFSFMPSFLSFTINYFNFSNSLFIISGSFNEPVLLCKS